MSTMPERPPRSYDLQQLLPRLLELAPALREPYAEMKQGWGTGLTDKDIEELEEIARMHGLNVSYHAPGMTIVFENLLAPHLVQLSSSRDSHKQLKQLMDWIEELASSEHFEVRNLVGLSICLPLLANYASNFAKLFPLMGENTIALCKELTTDYRFRESVIELLG